MVGLSRAVAEIIGRKLDYDEEKKRVLAYGAFGIIQFSFSMILVIVAGIVFNILLEAIIILFTAAALRKFSGGAHASTPTGCLVAGTVVVIAIAFTVSRLLTGIGTYYMAVYIIAGIAFSFYAIRKYAPVDNPNKPIRKEERRKRLRSGSLVFAGVISAASVILFTYYVFFKQTGYLRSLFLAMTAGMSWQSFTLLKSGHLFISRMEAVINIPIKLMGGEKR